MGRPRLQTLLRQVLQKNAVESVKKPSASDASVATDNGTKGEYIRDSVRAASTSLLMRRLVLAEASALSTGRMSNGPSTSSTDTAIYDHLILEVEWATLDHVKKVGDFF
ncbi:hypothetical protein Droror1_Dr00019123 [Drosera rotundifolia]